jgi:caspase domain-containing protein
MRARLPLAFLASALALGALLIVRSPFPPKPSPSRGVRLASPPRSKESSYDPAQSAALFLGVRDFGHEDTLEVKYAADDAVDLAYTFSRERVALVAPTRMVIALSGRPQKEESRRHLADLIREGARLEKAAPSDILLLLQQQAALAGRDGLLVVSIASHGFARGGVPYILGSTSLFRYPETALPLPKLLDMAGSSEASRSLFLIDACRERISSDTRAGASPDTAAPLISRMKKINGQVVFYAAAPGGYAYDSDGNGVFTKAVLDGLHCKAGLIRGAVTVATLHTFVENTVRRWILEHHNSHVLAATQVSIEGRSEKMPLCNCVGQSPPPPEDVARAAGDGSTITAFATDGRQLWSHRVDGTIAHVEVADLNGDGGHEVVAGTGHALYVFDRAGRNLWSTVETMTLRMFVIDHLQRRDPTLQIVAAWNDERAAQSVISTYDGAGERLSAYTGNGELQRITVDRPTSRHNRRIVVTGKDREGKVTLLMLDSHAELLWQGILLPASRHLVRLGIGNRDQYSREITLFTSAGETLHLDFDGNTLEKSSADVKLQVLQGKASHRTRA